MKSERIFGTDGVRGRAGEGWLAPEAVSALGSAVGELIAARAEPGSSRRVLLGHDGRRSGPGLEAALAAGLAQYGFEATSAGLITTPGLALLARLEDFQLGAMISASHNPAEDNGIKLFSHAGEKLPDELELLIEERLRARPALALPPARVPHDPQLEGRYLAYLLEHGGRGLNLHGLSLVVDCANGGASRVAPRVFARLGAQVRAFAAEPDGDNINLRCGATKPQALQEEVRRQGAQLGIALDGDGDRCLLADERGELVDGDGILTLLARAMAGKGELAKSRIAATVMSNKGLHRALREAGVSVATTDVGDRRVVEELRRGGLQLGGEQSGHIVFGPDHFYIGDGIYTALRVLRVMRASGAPLSELAGAYRPFPQVLLNVSVRSKPALSSLAGLSSVCARIEAELGEDGRVLLRYSGTESLARVMVEGPDLDTIRAQAKELANVIAAEIGSTP